MASVTILPSGLLQAAPNSKPDIAGVGVGGKGWGDITETSKDGAANVIAFCDVETGAGRRKKGSSGFGAAAEKWPDAKRYTDWRELLDKEGKRLNGVTVSTPDHMHAPVTMTALNMGIATYTQKPLTRTIYEARQLTLAAKKAGVATQMGNQGHSGVPYRTLVQLIQSNAIGKVKEAHTWSNRPSWPQGIDRPTGSSPVPESLNWDLWLGVAPARPYVEGVYCPFNWRGWYDFGAVRWAIWAATLSIPFSGAWPSPRQRKSGTTARGQSRRPSPPGKRSPTNSPALSTRPIARFASNGTTASATAHLNLPPADLAQLPGAEKLPANGSLFIGEKGVLLCEHGGPRSMPRLLPEDRFVGYPIPQLEDVDHYLQWTNAIRGEGKTTSNFDYAGALTETVLLGTVASRFAGDQLAWDSANLRFTNVPKANDYVRQPYRKGWEVSGLS